MKIAIVGATGLVGRKIIDVLEEQQIPVSSIVPVASEKSVGSSVTFKGNSYTVVTPEQAIEQNCQAAIFSAGSKVSQLWAPQFSDKGCYVIDNSSFWRMDPAIPLVVPEINADVLSGDTKIIANPNCSTIQMVVALHPLHNRFGLKRIIVSTYQSVSGTGAKGIAQLQAERNNKRVERAYPHPIDQNILPHIDSFTENGFTKEEMKMINETRKILRSPNLAITATTVRVPVSYCHSESVYFELHQAATLEEIHQLWRTSEGIVLQDHPSENTYPMPITSRDKDDVFVGRLRADLFTPNAFNCWIVSDNLRKGAATNAVQILKYLISSKIIN